MVNIKFKVECYIKKFDIFIYKTKVNKMDKRSKFIEKINDDWSKFYDNEKQR